MSYSEAGGFVIVIFLVVGLCVFLILDWPEYAGYKSRASDKTYWDSIERIPNGVAFYPCPDDKDRHEHKHRVGEKKYWIASIAFSGITAFVAVVAAIFAGKAYVATSEQAEAANKTLTSIQRAFITVSKLNITPRKDGNIVYQWTVDPIIVNSGATPTVNLHYEIGFGGGDMSKWPLTREPPFDPPTFPSWAQVIKSGSTAVIGPQATVDNLTALNGFTASTVYGRSNFAGTGEFIWGTFVYGDIIEHTPTHITQFCFQIMRYNLTNDGMLHYERCKHHNCADEECR